MNYYLSHLPVSGRGPDIGAIAGAFIATATATVMSEWLQLFVLILTTVFLCLGIFLRWQKIRSHEIPDVDEEDEPTSHRHR